MLPEAGDDGRWIKENIPEFERRAKGGNEMMRDMVEEIKVRGLSAHLRYCDRSCVCFWTSCFCVWNEDQSCYYVVCSGQQSYGDIDI